MNKRVWIVFIIVVIVGLGALIWWQRSKDADHTKDVDYAAFDNTKVITKDNLPESYTGDAYVAIDNVGGKADSKVVVVEYADFQCPGCYTLSPSMKSIKEKYDDRVAFVYRYFPLSYHSNGVASAVAVEAAARQGKFWEMHDVVFENKPAWENASVADREDVFAGYAEQVGVDIAKWRADYQSYKTNGINDKINFEQNLGKAANITGTPTIIVNGVKVESATNDTITKAIDDALKGE